MKVRSHLDMTYSSSIPYEASRIHAAAIYCSDGRIGAQTAEFLESGLGLPRYDRVCLPGGAACLAGHSQAHVQQQGVVDELQFLVEAHLLERVVLVAHEGCAFYKSRLDLEEPRLELVQRADLVRAAAFVHQVTGLDNIEGFFARVENDRLFFEKVVV